MATKSRSVSKLKKLVWEQFSLYVRLKDAMMVGMMPMSICVTCGRLYPAIGAGCLQGGHFIPGRKNSYIFDERQVWPQCLTAESKLQMSDKKYKGISSIKVGDELLAFDDHDFTPAIAVVESVEKYLPGELYEIELEDGSKFYATPDHRVVANGEWVYIKDMLHDVLAYDILAL